MESKVPNDCNESVNTINTVDTRSIVDMETTLDTMLTVDTNNTMMATVDTANIQDIVPNVPSVDTMTVDDLVGAVDRMGSGDATSPLLIDTLTLEDVQDMILSDPSIMGILPPSVRMEELSESDTVVDKSVFISVKVEVNEVTTVVEKTRRSQEDIRLTHRDIYAIQRICSTIPGEFESDATFDLAQMDVLFRCEACQEMPICSETVHTCDFGHQVCGSCYNIGIRTCLVCKGHLSGNNLPLENVLRRLRENYPYMFHEAPPHVNMVNYDYLTRFFSLKPLMCPEGNCDFQTTASKICEHFRYEHKHVPKINLPLFEPCLVKVPERLLENVTRIVIAAVTLYITEERIASKLATNTMTCWVQCGVVNINNDQALVMWVSCAYDNEIMPPILCSIRASTSHGHSSFGGEMIPLLDNMNPQSILETGKCLLLLPKDIQNVITENGGSLVVELKFYIR